MHTDEPLVTNEGQIHMNCFLFNLRFKTAHEFYNFFYGFGSLFVFVV